MDQRIDSTAIHFHPLGPLLNDVQHDRSIIGQRTRTAGDYREDVYLYVRERPATGQQVKKWLLNEIGWGIERDQNPSVYNNGTIPFKDDGASKPYTCRAQLRRVAGCSD